MMRIVLLVAVVLLATFCTGQREGGETVVLEKNEGEKRVRRPRETLPSASSEFILKVTPENSGSNQLVLGTEEIPPGGVIPRHKHFEQDEILLVQTGAGTRHFAPGFALSCTCARTILLGGGAKSAASIIIITLPDHKIAS
jgi:hypothetical protein